MSLRRASRRATKPGTTHLHSHVRRSGATTSRVLLANPHLQRCAVAVCVAWQCAPPACARTCAQRTHVRTRVRTHVVCRQWLRCALLLRHADPRAQAQGAKEKPKPKQPAKAAAAAAAAVAEEEKEEAEEQEAQVRCICDVTVPAGARACAVRGGGSMV